MLLVLHQPHQRNLVANPLATEVLKSDQLLLDEKKNIQQKHEDKVREVRMGIDFLGSLVFPFWVGSGIVEYLPTNVNHPNRSKAPARFV